MDIGSLPSHLVTSWSSRVIVGRAPRRPVGDKVPPGRERAALGALDMGLRTLPDVALLTG